MYNAMPAVRLNSTPEMTCYHLLNSTPVIHSGDWNWC